MAKVSPIGFKSYKDTNGTLCVYESGQGVPFDIQRVFTVCAKPGDMRGNHAHKQCTQLLLCVSGKIQVRCDDGTVVSHHVLDSMGNGLLVHPSVWAEEEYLENNSVLMVLCDRIYEADDYIRDYQEFKRFVKEKES